MKSILSVFGILLFANLLIFSVFFAPEAALAQNDSFKGPLVPNCGQTVGENGTLTNPCGWEHLVQLGINIMRFGIYLMTILSVLGITYAGWLYITSQGSSGQIAKAHDIFTKVAFGIFFTLGAWLIVNSVLKWLGVSEYFSILSS